MRFDAITLFPEIFAGIAAHGVTSRALSQGLWSFKAWNPRDYTQDVHRTVDDRPYGGGPGMVMLAAPLEAALRDAQADRERLGQPRGQVVLLSPTGRRFDQAAAAQWVAGPGKILVCGRYEGVDQRFVDRCVDEEWSLGDFVLSGGELAAVPMMDACVRLLPGVLNDDQSALQDSFHANLDGLLDSPHYTRPEVYDGEPVPEALLSGHHARIARWRRDQSLRLTLARRPELIEAARREGRLDKADEKFLLGLQS